MIDKNKIAPNIWMLCDKIYNKRLKLTEGKKEMFDKHQLSQTSFHFYYYAYKGMLEGTLCTRTIQPEIRDCMLWNIYEKYGVERLKIALYSFKKHIYYYENKRNTTVHKERILYNKYSNLLQSSQRQDTEDELLAIIKNIDRQKIINELKSIKVTDPEQIIINSKIYSRDNKTVVQLKYLHDFKCQICGIRIPKADGTYYIEAAHITPKAKKGPELPNNILILCPNHHKEFDFGKLMIVDRDDKFIHFILNGQEYKISLDLESL